MVVGLCFLFEKSAVSIAVGTTSFVLRSQGVPARPHRDGAQRRRHLQQPGGRQPSNLDSNGGHVATAEDVPTAIYHGTKGTFAF